METGLTIRAEIQLNTDILRIWDVLTNPEWTAQYMFGCAVKSDWIAGSAIIWKAPVNGVDTVFVKGDILHIEVGRLLQYTTFDPNSGLEDTPANYTTVTYSLIPEHGHTILSVSQGDFSKIADGQRRYNESLAGWKMVLNKIKTLAEAKQVAL